MDWLFYALCAVGGLAIGVGVGIIYRMKAAESKIGSAETQAKLLPQW